MVFKGLIAAGVVVALATPCRAQAVMGAGAFLCRTWIADRNNQVNHAVEVSWMLGYLTAINLASSAPMLTGKSREDVEAGIDVFCRANPQMTMAEAAAGLGLMWLQTSNGKSRQ